MTLTASEQYLLELMNRARLDPGAEALRMGIDLNQSLGAGTLTYTARQVVAPNAMLEAAATKHSVWQLATDTLSQTGQGGSQPFGRMLAEGYRATTYAENLGIVGLGVGQSLQTGLEDLHRTLFLSADNRIGLLTGGLREVGIGAETGIYTQNGQNYNAVALTLNLATTGTAHFLTGVAYRDTDKNAFYSIGEGTGNVVFKAAGQTTATAAAGGYSLGLGSSVSTAVSGHVGALNFALTVDMSAGNVKLDVVDGATFATSGNVTLGTGINNVVMLGAGFLAATGNAAGNSLTGNNAANALTGLGGNDKLSGFGGNDKIDGGFGRDVLTGGKGIDMMTGGAGADVFVFTALEGLDKIVDFTLAAGDRLRIDDALWGGADLKASEIISRFATKGDGEVVLDFGPGEQIRLLGLTGMGGLAAAIDIF